MPAGKSTKSSTAGRNEASTVYFRNRIENWELSIHQIFSRPSSARLPGIVIFSCCDHSTVSFINNDT